MLQPHSLPVVSEESQAGVSLPSLAERIDGICSANIFVQRGNLNIQIIINIQREFKLFAAETGDDISISPHLTWLGIRSTDSAGCTRPFMASNLWMLGTARSLQKMTPKHGNTPFAKPNAEATHTTRMGSSLEIILTSDLRSLLAATAASIFLVLELSTNFS